MINELARKIIREQLQNILMEAGPSQRVPLVRLDTGKIVAVEPGNVDGYVKGNPKTGTKPTHRPPDPKELEQFQQQQGGGEKPPQDPNVATDPNAAQDTKETPPENDDLEGNEIEVNLDGETPSWVTDEKYVEAVKIATNINLVPSEVPGVFADVSGEKPIGVAAVTDDPDNPLGPVVGLPPELVDLIGEKINDEMESQNNDDEDTADEEPEQEPETQAGADGEVDTASMDEFSKTVYGETTGVVAGLDLENGKPNSKPPSDAIARQTALETGFPPPKKPIKSPTTGEWSSPAPGNLGSMYNEILSVEGCDIAIEFEKANNRPMTVDEMVYVLDKQFAKTKVVKEIKEGGEAGYQKKLRIVAEASVRKNLRFKTAMKNNPDFGEVVNTEQFYGAADSLAAQANTIATMPEGAKVFGPQGEIKEINVSDRSRTELTEAAMALAKKMALAGDKFPGIEVSGPKSNPQVDPDSAAKYIDDMMSNPKDQANIRSFVTLMSMAGGGGANPSDTATFVQADNGNVMVMWHSDKMERGDQQANSTLVKEASNQIETVESMVKDGTLSEEQAQQAVSVLQEFNKNVDQLEAADPSPVIAGVLIGMMKNKNSRKDIERAFGDLKDGYKEIIAGKDGNRTFEEFLDLITSDGYEPTKPQQKIFAKLSNELEASATSLSPRELASVNSLQLGVQARKDVVSSIHNRINQLDKIASKSGPLGQLLEAHNIINKLHLYAMNDPSDLAYQSGMCETIIGSSGVNGEVLRQALGVNSTDELLDNIKVGPPETKEGDYTDPDTGMPEAMLQRSTNDFETGPGGEKMIWVTDTEGNVVGKAPEGSDLKPGQQFKTLKDGKTPVGVGVVTGQKSLIYYQNKDGKKFPISMQMVRSKAGATGRLGTAYVYSKELQALIKQLEKAGLVAEAIARFLRKKRLVDTTVSDFKVTPLPPLSSIVEDIRENTPMELFLEEIENGIYIDE
jgi:hypothetical protein